MKKTEYIILTIITFLIGVVCLSLSLLNDGWTRIISIILMPSSFMLSYCFYTIIDSWDEIMEQYKEDEREKYKKAIDLLASQVYNEDITN